MRNVVEMCRRAILAIDAACISWPATLALLHLPPGLQEVEAFSSLAEVGGVLRFEDCIDLAVLICHCLAAVSKGCAFQQVTCFHTHTTHTNEFTRTAHRKPTSACGRTSTTWTMHSSAPRCARRSCSCRAAPSRTLSPCRWGT